MGATGYIIKGSNGGRGGKARKEVVVSAADGTIDVDKVETFDKVDFRIKTTYDGYETINVGSPASGGYFKAAHIKFNEENRRYRLVCILNGGSYTPVAKDFAIYYIKFGWRTGGVNADHWYIEEYSRQGNGAYVSLEQIALNEYNVLIHTPTGYSYANIGILKEDKEPDVTIDHFNKNTTRYTPTGTIIETETPAWKNGALVDTNPEDLEIRNGLLQLADRSSTNGLGYVILRPDKTFAEQVTQSNCIYEVRYNFDLGGRTVTIPSNCVLQFEGGKLSNGTISLSNSKIVADDYQIFDNILFSSVLSFEGRPEWFGAKADGETNDTSAIQNTINAFEKTILSGYRYLITSVDVEQIANPWGRKVINNSTIISTGEGIRLNSNCRLRGGRINVRANSVGITIGRTDNVEAHNRISVEDVTIIGLDKSTETYGVKCIASEGNHYNAFCHIDNVMVYGCRHGFYGNIRSSYININIEGCYDNFNLTNGSLNGIILTGNASTSIPEYPDFATINGELNNVNFKVYDVGSGSFQKNPIKFIGVDNTVTGYDRNIKNSDVSNFSSSPYFKGGSFKVESPIFSCNVVNIINPDVKKDYLEKNAFRLDLNERCYVELYKEDRTQDAYVEFNFGPVWQFMAVNLLCATTNDSFDKIEVRGDINEEPFISVSNNYEKPFINVHVNTYKEFFNYDANFNRQVYPNLCIRCYVSNFGKTRFLGGEFFAHSARTMPKNGTTAQRPILSATDAGFRYFDTDLGKPIFWSGLKWVDANGNDLQ